MIAELLQRFIDQPAPPQGITSNPFKLMSSVSPPATLDAIERAWRGRHVPEEAIDLWLAGAQADLFRDVEYGQWGLRLLPPPTSAERTASARAQRPADFRADDVVIGEFLGDLDLLVLAPSERGSRRVLVALPLDERAEWRAAGTCFADFLATYLDRHGDKFWEVE